MVVRHGLRLGASPISFVNPDMPKIPPLRSGEARQWLRCRTCGRVQHYDYVPYSLSTALRFTVCGHGNGERDLGCDEIYADEAIIALSST
jgi:hypothetical protein